MQQQRRPQGSLARPARQQRGWSSAWIELFEDAGIDAQSLDRTGPVSGHVLPLPKPPAGTILQAASPTRAKRSPPANVTTFETIDLAAVKRKQQTMWSTATSVIASSIHIVAERLADSASICCCGHACSTSPAAPATPGHRRGPLRLRRHLHGLRPRPARAWPRSARTERASTSSSCSMTPRRSYADGSFDAVTRVRRDVRAARRPGRVRARPRVPPRRLTAPRAGRRTASARLFRATGAHVRRPPLSRRRQHEVVAELVGDEVDLLGRRRRGLAWSRDAAEFIVECAPTTARR